MSGYTSPVSYNNSRLRDGIFLHVTVIQYSTCIVYPSYVRSVPLDTLSWFAKWIFIEQTKSPLQRVLYTLTLFLTLSYFTLNPYELAYSVRFTEKVLSVLVCFKPPGALLVTIPKRTFLSYTLRIDLRHLPLFGF